MKEDGTLRGYDYSVALITATDTETFGAKALYPSWKEVQFDGDPQTYFVSSFERGHTCCPVVLAQRSEMGMTAAAVLSMKLFQRFRPRYIISVGIAAGIASIGDDEQFYGDVVVADMIWNYVTGKFVGPQESDIRFGTVGFIPRPAAIRLEPMLKKYVQSAAESAENQCHVRIGPMACGSMVVANQEILDKQVHSQFPDTVGLDMESYAVAYAAEHAVHPRPAALVIKGVSDYANGEKSDEYQKFAAYTSAQFAKFLYERFLPL